MSGAIANLPRLTNLLLYVTGGTAEIPRDVFQRDLTVREASQYFDPRRFRRVRMYVVFRSGELFAIKNDCISRLLFNSKINEPNCRALRFSCNTYKLSPVCIEFLLQIH